MYDWCVLGVAGQIVYAWFAAQSYHNSPASLNAANNGIFRSHVNDASASIKIRNCPLPRSVAEQIGAKENGNVDVTLPTFIVYGLALLGASLILFPLGNVNHKG